MVALSPPQLLNTDNDGDDDGNDSGDDGVNAVVTVVLATHLHAMYF